MLRPRASIALSLDAPLPRLVRPLHVSAVQYKAKKIYRGEPPKRPKPKEHPRAPAAIGIPHVQKGEIPEKVDAGAASAKEKKDPLQGMREANEMSRMVKYPAAAAQHVAAANQLPSKEEQEASHETTAESEAAAAAISKNAAANMHPVPTMSSNAPRGGPYKPPPPKSSPSQTKFIIAAIAGTFFLAGAYMAFGPGPGSYRQDLLGATSPAPARGAPTPKEKPMPASLKRALELLKAYFKERASSLDEDVEEFSGAGIIGIGGGKNFPKMVVYPESTEEVEIILNICQKYGVAVIPYSGGTSLEGYSHRLP
jgi:FAD binding domain